jgi:hypothetical protein
MSDAARIAEPLADPVDVFRARCRAQATLVAAGDLDLIESVDELQAAAERVGLVTKLGQDRVQAVISEAFQSQEATT